MVNSYSSIPILALCGGGIGPVTLDLLEQRREERVQATQEGRRPSAVLIRTLSYVTGNPKSLKAWTFLVGCTLYAVLGGMSGFLQADVLAAAEEGNSKTKGVLLVLYPIIVGLLGVSLVFPGTAAHVIVAGCFQMFSIVYCFEAVQLATAVFGKDATITTVCSVFAYTGVAGLVLSFLMGGYVMGKTDQLVQHNKAMASSRSQSSSTIIHWGGSECSDGNGSRRGQTVFLIN
ncbi:hypothetical protein ACHAWF_001242 [Thalassiosira exigua]